MNKVILSLCDHSGEWSRPYLEAGYEVVRVDLKLGNDVRLIPRNWARVHGVLAAPPCNHFARSGALHWAAKGEAALLEGLSIVDACLRQVAICRPEWWALENPIGRLKDYLGEPAFRFDPCDFGDAWTKRTWLWGHFTPPMPLLSPALAAVEPIEVDVTTKRRGKTARSLTPEGFARAFFAANP
jgi:hypothetical protein